MIKSFAQAHKERLQFIDVNVIDKAVRYIIDYQQAGGHFINTGVVQHKAMQVIMGGYSG